VKSPAFSCRLLLQSLIQPNSDDLAHILTDDSPDFRLHRQHVFAITHRHERTAEWTTVDTAPDLNQSASFKEFDGLRPDDVSPSALVRTLLQFRGECGFHEANILPDWRKAQVDSIRGQQVPPVSLRSRVGMTNGGGAFQFGGASACDGFGW
jgi:hypothetical protein